MSIIGGLQIRNDGNAANEASVGREEATERRPIALDGERSSHEERSHEDMSNEQRSNEEMTAQEKEDYLVSFDGDHDPDNPRSMSTVRKWLITLVVCFSSLCVTFNSTLYTFTYDQIMPLFHVSREVATLGLSTFVVGLAIGPMFLAPLSEFYGRRPIYLVSYSMVFVWIIPCAVAQNIETIIITRFFDGMFASAFLSIAGGTIGDIFDKSQLSLPMMLYSGSPFLGPAIGPIIGGFINYYSDWRWSFWVLLIWTGTQLALIAFLIPETYHPVKLRHKAQRLRKSTGNSAWKAPIEIMTKSKIKTVMLSCYRPFQLLVREPMCLNLCILSALLLGILYLFFGAFVIVFERNHGFNLWQSGLTFIGILVGMLFAFVSNTIWGWNYRRLVHRLEQETHKHGASEPEFRLPPTIFGVWFCVAGLFAFGWTTQSSVHWAGKQALHHLHFAPFLLQLWSKTDESCVVPIAMSGLFGFGIVACFAGVFTFLVEAYPLYAASALAANSFARSVFAAAFPLFGVQMYDKLGFQWASSLLGFLMLLMAPFPLLFYKKGKQIRQASRFASGDR